MVDGAQFLTRVNDFGSQAKSGNRSTKLVYRFPKGINNRVRETWLEDGELRSAVNVDVSNNGSLLSRLAPVKVLDGGFHSLFKARNLLLLVKDGVLSRMDSSQTITAIYSLLYDAPIHYAELNGEYYWVSPYEQGRITKDGEAAPWGANTPPQIQASPTTGSLPAGIYKITQTAVLASGIESGAPEPVEVTLEEPGGILVTTPSGSVPFYIYTTSANGSIDELRLALQLGPGESAVIDGGYRGKTLKSLLAVKPYPGQTLCAYKGRLWVGSGPTLWVTSEWSPHWLFPHKGYIQQSVDIVLTEAVDDGLYVGTPDNVWFLSGTNPNDMSVRHIASIGVVPGSGFVLHASDTYFGQNNQLSLQCVWLDTEGYINIGMANGVVIRPTKQRYCAGQWNYGSMAFRQYEGIRQLMITGQEDEQGSDLVANDVSIAASYDLT